MYLYRISVSFLTCPCMYVIHSTVLPPFDHVLLIYVYLLSPQDDSLVHSESEVITPLYTTCGLRKLPRDRPFLIAQGYVAIENANAVKGHRSKSVITVLNVFRSMFVDS